MKRPIRGGLFLSFIFLMLVSCDFLGLGVNPLIGTWKANLFGEMTIKFDKDFSYHATSQNGYGVDVTETGTWSVDKGKLYISASYEVSIMIYTFNQNKDLLTLTPIEGGLSLSLVRQ